MDDEARMIGPCPGPCGGLYDRWAVPDAPDPALCEDCSAATPEAPG